MKNGFCEKNITYEKKTLQLKPRKTARRMRNLLVCVSAVLLFSFSAGGASAATLTHTAAEKTFLSYAQDVMDWNEYFYTGKHPDDGDGVVATGYINGKKFEFRAHSYYYGLASMALQGPFNDLQPNWGREYVFTDTDRIFQYFLWTIDDLGIVPPSVHGDSSTGFWNPYDIYDTIHDGYIRSVYSKSDWPDVEISKGHMYATHANGTYFMFDVEDNGDFSFWVLIN